MLEGIMSSSLGSQLQVGTAALKAASEQDQLVANVLDQNTQAQKSEPVQAAAGAGKGQVVDLTA